jgi:adenylate cyclase class 2
MYEVEVKVPADHEAVLDRLDSLEATALGTVRQTDTYYDAPHRDFAETDEALRLRREVRLSDGGPSSGRDVDGAGGDGVTTSLTYKGPLVDADSKTREEAETAVADADAMRDVLAGLGFEPAATVEKERRRYAHANYTVALDDVRGLGEYVEVEREAAAIERAREGAFEVLRALALDPDDQVRTSYLGLLLER